jgi:hypothetical protein
MSALGKVWMAMSVGRLTARSYAALSTLRQAAGNAVLFQHQHSTLPLGECGGCGKSADA